MRQKRAPQWGVVACNEQYPRAEPSYPLCPSQNYLSRSEREKIFRPSRLLQKCALIFADVAQIVVMLQVMQS